MKYIIMLGSEFIDGYVDRAEALQAYHEYVADEGEYHDFMLYKMLETHDTQSDRGEKGFGSSDEAHP